MKARTKLIATIAAFVLSIGAAIGVTYGVMAAQNATVTTPINVGYTSQEVAADLSATYQVGSGSAVAFETSTGATTISFDGTEDDDGTANVKSFVQPTAQATTLTKTNNTITFVFTIVNHTDAAVTATLTLPSTQTNVTVTKTGNSNTLNIAADTSGTGVTATYTVTVTITNVAKDAAFSGDFSWTLARA